MENEISFSTRSKKMKKSDREKTEWIDSFPVDVYSTCELWPEARCVRPLVIPFARSHQHVVADFSGKSFHEYFPTRLRSFHPPTQGHYPKKKLSCESINKASQKRYTFALHDNQAFLDVVALVPPLALVAWGLIRFHHPHTITAPLISSILGSHRKKYHISQLPHFFLSLGFVYVHKCR